MSINRNKRFSGVLIILNMIYIIISGYILLYQNVFYPNQLYKVFLSPEDYSFGLICCYLSICVQLSWLFHYKKIAMINLMVITFSILSLILKAFFFEMFIEHFFFFDLYPLVLLIIGFLFVYFNKRRKDVEK